MNSKFSVKEIYRRQFTIVTLIENIKADFIKHNYPYIIPPINEDGITFLGKEDICAMKLHAIVQSVKRLKDYIDIYFLLEYFRIKQMLDFFIKKYSYSNPIFDLKALSFLMILMKQLTLQNHRYLCQFLQLK